MQGTHTFTNEDIEELTEAVNRLIKMTTQKTAGQRPNTTHINLRYGIYENCMLRNNPCIIGKIGRIKKSDRIGHNKENGGLRYGRI